MNQTPKNLEFLGKTEENKKTIQKMVLDSYQDIKDAKGRDYKEFFDELEKIF